MTIYTNPTGTISATAGSDSIIFNVPPASGFTVDALGGYDSLSVQFDSATPITFDVSDEFSAGFFDVEIMTNPFAPVYVLHVENVDLHGSANNDTFYLSFGPSSSGLTVNMDGGPGLDTLRYVASTMTTGINFVVNGANVTSSFGTFANFEQFYIFGGSGNDTITTGAGDDQVYTGTGVDHVSTGAGNDYIEIESSGGTFDAGDGNDSVYLYIDPSSPTTFAGSVDGGLGLDHLQIDWSGTAAGQNFVLSGSTVTSGLGSFANFESFGISAGSGDDTITTGSGDDTIYAGAGNDIISTGDGTNNVNAGEGNDTVTGGIGNDTLVGSHGNDTLSGGDGNDTIYGDDNIFSSVGDGSDHLDGGAGNDTIYGGGGDDAITGGAGDDSLVGGRGSDHLDGGDGNDHLDGFGGYGYGPDDNLPDVLIGGAGDDVITAGYGDTVDGGTGTDQLYYNAFGGPAGITADFSKLTSGQTITVGGATLSGFEYVTGISGTDYNDTIVAGAVPGVDGITISGWGGDDNLTGSSGNDTIYGGDGNDIIHGGIGTNPSISPSGDRLFGENGDDTIYIGSDGALASGGSGNDTIYGGSGYDEISGDAGNDILYGGGGDDGLQGNDGDDFLSGGAGHDTMSGGAGNDTFSGTAAELSGDTITDLAPGDQIVITDANINSFSFNLSGNTLTYSGGSLTVSGGEQWPLVATAAPGGGVAISLQLPPVSTVDQIAKQLTSGYWDGDIHHWAISQGGTLTVNVSTLTPTEQNLARNALQEWTDIIGVHFQEVMTGGQIVFDDSEGPSGSVAQTDSNWASGIMASAHIQISSSWITQYGSTLDSYGFQTYIHEIGHALGLGHAGNYNVTANFYRDALFLNDSWATSIMSYFDQGQNSYFNDQGFTVLNAVTPMMSDIAAMQSLYGLSTTTRPGNTVYGYNSNAGSIYDATAYQRVAYTIFDSGGNDTIDFSGSPNAQLINLNPETFSNVNGWHGNLSIGRGVVIENAIGGSSPDILIGNYVDNVLTGNAGSDVLTGGAGNDTFLDTEAGHNGDTITDFSRGDRIVFTDATLTNFTMRLSGDQLSYTGGTLTLANHNASIAVSAAPEGGVQISFSGPPIVVSAGGPVLLASASSVSQGAEMIAANLPVGNAGGLPHDYRLDHLGWHADVSIDHHSGWPVEHPTAVGLFGPF